MLGKSRQQLIDEKMCRPGYTWNDTLQKCLPAYGAIGTGETPSKPELPDPEQTPEAVMPATPEEQPKRAKAKAKAKAAAPAPAAPVE